MLFINLGIYMYLHLIPLFYFFGAHQSVHFWLPELYNYSELPKNFKTYSNNFLQIWHWKSIYLWFPKLTPVTIRRTLLSGGLQQVNLISGIQDTTSVPIIRRFTSLAPNLKKRKVLWTMVVLYDNTSTPKYIVIHL